MCRSHYSRGNLSSYPYTFNPTFTTSLVVFLFLSISSDPEASLLLFFLWILLIPSNDLSDLQSIRIRSSSRCLCYSKIPDVFSPYEFCSLLWFQNKSLCKKIFFVQLFSEKCKKKKKNLVLVTWSHVSHLSWLSGIDLMATSAPVSWVVVSSLHMIPKFVLHTFMCISLCSCHLSLYVPPIWFGFVTKGSETSSTKKLISTAGYRIKKIPHLYCGC